MRTIGEYDDAYFRRQSPLGLALKLLGVVVGLIVVLTVVGFGLGWFRASTAVVSPTNVKAQWQFAYDYNANLKAIAGQWCTAKSAEDSETNPEYKPQRTSQRIAIEQNYDRVKGIYDGRLADAFRAKLVRPSDVPDHAPTLKESTAALGCG